MAHRLRYSLLVLMLATADSAFAYTAEDCIECHREGSVQSTLQISIDEFKSSIHQDEASCLDCHTMVTDESHETTPGSGAADCSDCHEQENPHGRGSVTATRPQCYSCHTRHAMRAKDDPRSATYPQRLKETCKSCHPRESGETDYLSWLPSLQIASHNKRDFSQSYNKDNCLGCHQGQAAHGESEPISDQTCFSCHLNAEGRNALLGYFHIKARDWQQPGILAAAAVYQVILMVLIFGGFKFFIRKLSAGKKAGSQNNC